MPQWKPNEHVAMPLDCDSQAKRSPKAVAGRRGAPKKGVGSNQKLATHGCDWREQILSTHPMKKPTAKLLKAIVQHHDFERTDFEYPPDYTSKMIEILVLGLEGIEWTKPYDRLQEVGIRAFESLMAYLKILR